MFIPQTDTRSPQKKKKDEEIAAEPQLAPLNVPADAVAEPVEAHLSRSRHPIALLGVVENGLVRPLDPSVKLQEHARVIIVATEKL